MQVLTGLLELKERVLADPDFFENATDLPYDGQTLSSLKKILAPQIVTKTIEKEVAAKESRGRPTKDITLSQEDQEKVRTELQKLLDNLNTMADGPGLETSERIQITRLKTNLIEQLLKLQERAFNVKKMSQFQEVVVGILDDLMSESDREQFLKRIDPYR